MSRRLFEQPENTNPTLSKSIAFGGVSQITETITWTNFITWITTKLPFLKTTNNLSDLADAATARTNLGVYSSGETDTLLDAKADTLDVLEKTNTVVYTPTSNYHPATKVYVDGGGLSTSWLDGVKVSSKVDAAESIFKCKRVGGHNTITGTIKLNSQASKDETLFTIHSSMPICTQNIYFNASDDSPSDENYEMYIAANTRNVKAFTDNGSTASRACYTVTYPHG